MGQEENPKSISGRLLVVLLLIVVAVATAYAVYRIAGSVENTAENPSETAGTQQAGQPRPGGMPAYQLTPEDINLLQEAGLSDPIHDLLADLEQHPELVPLDSMGLLADPVLLLDQSRVISPTRVKSTWATEADTGWVLLEYSVSEGAISWTVLEYGSQSP